jgi:hypothetical protein
MNRYMMDEFSRRTVAALKQHTLFKVTLPVFQSFLELNVRKEVEKDCQVITRAATLCQTGARPGDGDVRKLLQQSREIDQTFLQEITVFPITINIDYVAIEKTRQQRIRCLLLASHRIFTQWEFTPQISAVITDLHDYQELSELLYSILCLYCIEAKMLSRSVRIPSAFSFARNKLTEIFSNTMHTVAKDLSTELADRIHRRSEKTNKRPREKPL